MERPLRLCLLLCILLSAAPATHAQPASKSPRIGLALGGGSARGLAHIGVLQWLEEHRIPIHCIAGTSMGGLVGAFYATGSSPEEMRRLVRQIPWDDAMRGVPSYRNLSFRRKEDRRAFPNVFELGLRHGLKFPVGLNGGHQIGQIFDRLALPYHDVHNYDELAIPFRCIATDVISGTPVVLKDGPLGESLRATMAIPGLFTPVEVDGRLLADGGILNNLPVDAVREMGADIVIAVLIDASPVRQDAVISFIGMIDRSFDLMVLQNELRSMREAEIGVILDLAPFGSGDYKSGDAIADLGYRGMEKKAAVLERLSVDQPAWEYHIAQRKARARTSLPVTQFVQVEGTRAEASTVIAGRLSDTIGKPWNREHVETELARITGWGRYDSLGYRFLRAGDQTGLAVRVREKVHAPPFLHFGLEVDGSEINNVKFKLSGRLTALDVGRYRAEWRTDFGVGSWTGLRTEYYRPLAGTGWFVAPNALYERVQGSLFREEARLAEYQLNRSALGLDLGYGFGRFSELRLGGELGHTNTFVRIGDPLLPEISGGERLLSARWTYDALDSALLPRRGLAIRTRLDWIIESPEAPGAFPRAELATRFFVPVSLRSSAFVAGSAGSTFGEEASFSRQFTLGGPLRLGALAPEEIRTNQYWYGAGGLLRVIGSLPPLFGGKLYAAGWYELGHAYGPDSPRGYNHTGSAGLAIETVFGPLFLGGSIGQTGRGRVYFMLGRLF